MMSCVPGFNNLKVSSGLPLDGSIYPGSVQDIDEIIKVFVQKTIYITYLIG